MASAKAEADKSNGKSTDVPNFKYYSTLS